MNNSEPTSRERILAAATLLFIQNGYNGTGVQEISDAVGIGRGALYHHIGSKEQLLFEISMSLLQPVTDEARSISATDEQPEVKLRALARALLAHHAEYGDAWSVAVQEARMLSPEHRAKVIAARDDYETIWANVLDKGTAIGVWRPVDALESRGILGMLNSTARWMQPDGELSPEEIADRYVDLLLHGLHS